MKPKKPYWEMTADELAEATKQFDDPHYVPKFLKAPAHEQAKLDRALERIRRGRPTNGLGAQRVQVSMEKSLLTRADRYAKAHGMTRSQLIAEGVKMVMAR